MKFDQTTLKAVVIHHHLSQEEFNRLWALLWDFKQGLEAWSREDEQQVGLIGGDIIAKLGSSGAPVQRAWSEAWPIVAQRWFEDLSRPGR